MFKIVLTKRLRKGLRKYKNDLVGEKKMKKIILLLRSGKKLPSMYKEHRLKGKFKDFYECHLEPNLLLIFKRIKEDKIIDVTIDKRLT